MKHLTYPNLAGHCAVFAQALALAASLGIYVVSAQAQNRQTPIDINATNVVLSQVIPAVTVTYGTADLSVVNTYVVGGALPKEFTTVRANVPANAGVLVTDGKTYDLLQFHFHTPAEHALGSLRAPMEVHFVHKDRAKNVGDPDSLLVVGAWIVRGATNAELEKIFANLPGPGGTVPVTAFDLSKVLPAGFGTTNQTSFTYPGGLTAPTAVPGSTVQDQLASDIFPEIVSWIVLPDAIELADSQIQRFRALYPEVDGNARPLQDLAGRHVITDLTASQFAVDSATYNYRVLPRIAVGKAIRLDFDNLIPGSPYQLQSSTELNLWTDYGTPFIPITSNFSEYLDVTSTNSFFRLHP